MAEGSEGQLYCRNCGAELRPGMTFCTSCGAPVSSGAGGPGPSSSGPDGPRRLGSFVGDLRRSFRRSADGLRGTFSGSADGLRDTFSGVGTDGIRRLPGKTVAWFRGLSGVPKLVLVGLVLLVLLVLLSPVAVIVAGLLFGVSIIALIIRLAQKRSVKNWGMVAVGSVVLMFTFGFMSNALYGIGFMGSSGSGSEQSSGGSNRSEENPAGDSGNSNSATPTSAASPSASPSALPDSNQVSITGEIFGYPETFNYDGLTVTGTVVDWNGDHIMVIQDPMQGVGVILGTPGQQVTVHGEYQGTITTSDGGTYEAVMAEEVE